METLEITSQKIQNLLLSVPQLASNLKRFFYFPKDDKNKFLDPISFFLKGYNLSTEDVIEVLDTYSKNLHIKNIDEECEKIKNWLLDENRQAEDGSWPLAGDPGSEYRKNAWATAICCLALLKFRQYKKVYDNFYDEKISNSKRWLFDTSNNLYIPDKGWKQHSGATEINLYDTCIAINTILRYKFQYENSDNYFIYTVSDPEIENIIKYLFKFEEDYDIGANSYIVMALVHFYNELQKKLDDNLKIEIQEKIFKKVNWIVQNYEDNIGWKNNINKPSLEISCYAIQALNKCKSLLEDTPKDETQQLQNTWGEIVKIIVSEIARIQNCFIYSSDSWGWPDECGSNNIHLHNTSLATSTLLKCCYRSDIIIDLSIILRAINYLIKSFDWERNTLENTYILCTIMDYLMYRIKKGLIF